MGTRPSRRHTRHTDRFTLTHAPPYPALSSTPCGRGASAVRGRVASAQEVSDRAVGGPSVTFWSRHTSFSSMLKLNLNPRGPPDLHLGRVPRLASCRNGLEDDRSRLPAARRPGLLGLGSPSPAGPGGGAALPSVITSRHSSHIRLTSLYDSYVEACVATKVDRFSLQTPPRTPRTAIATVR